MCGDPVTTWQLVQGATPPTTQDSCASLQQHPRHTGDAVNENELMDGK